MDLCVTSNISRRRPDRSAVPFAEAVSLAGNAGFTQMDYSFSASQLAKDSWKEDAMADLETARRAGIRFRYAHLPYDYPKNADGWQDFYRATLRAIDLAVIFGVDCAAIHPNTSMTKAFIPDVRKKTLDFLRPYADYAKEKGLVLALENMRGAGRGADPEIRRYLTQVDDLMDIAQTLDTGICWDTGHGNISGQEQYSSLLKVAPRLKMLHFNDNYAEDDIHLAPFLGSINWVEVVEALRKVGFKGAINLEVTTNRLPLNARAAYAAYMAKAAEQLAGML